MLNYTKKGENLRISTKKAINLIENKHLITLSEMALEKKEHFIQKKLPLL